jgi:hypothetical protein
MQSVRNLIAGISYMKSTLDGIPAFVHDVAASADRPQRLTSAIPFPLPSQGSRGEMATLGAVLKYTLGSLRWEPLNPYGLHRGIPVPRTLLSTQIWLAGLETDGGPSTVARYLPDHHALEPLGQLEPSAAVPALTLCIVADVCALGRWYGYYSVVLMTLEAGMAWAQLVLQARANGLEVTAKLEGSPVSAFLPDAGMVPIHAMRIAGGSPQMTLQSAVRVATSDRAALDSFREGLPLLSGWCAQLSPERAAAAHAVAIATPSGAETLLSPQELHHWTRKRSSGCDAEGWVLEPNRFTPVRGTAFLTNWRRLKHAAGGCLEREPPLEIYVVMLGPGPAAPGLYRVDAGGQLRLVAVGNFDGVLSRALLISGYNVASLSMSVLIVGKLQALLANDDGREFLRLNVAAGFEAQLLLLAAASVGMAARPIRMYDEALLEQALQFKGQVLLQVLCGFTRRANLGYAI